VNLLLALISVIFEVLNKYLLNRGSHEDTNHTQIHLTDAVVENAL
jgi:hypothetical protein